MIRWTTLGLAAVLLSGCGDDTFDADAGDLSSLGRAYVDARGCATCHQSAGGNAGTLAGQASAVPGTSSFGSNLTSDRQTGLGGWADIQIVRALRAGLDNTDQVLCPTMPRYPDMSDVEARAITAYLRSLPAVQQAIDASVCPPIKPTPALDLSATVGDMAVAPAEMGAGD